MLIRLLISSSLLVLSFVGCSSPTSTNTPEPKTVQVSMIDSAFQPSETTINVNDTVEWSNDGLRTHTSTSGTSGTPDGIWNSGDLAPGATYSRKFTETGTFNYYCTYHFAMGMTGKIIVVSP
jgi:plastocyanin